jgi:hypothetical protein
MAGDRRAACRAAELDLGTAGLNNEVEPSTARGQRGLPIRYQAHAWNGLMFTYMYIYTRTHTYIALLYLYSYLCLSVYLCVYLSIDLSIYLSFAAPSVSKYAPSTSVLLA